MRHFKVYTNFTNFIPITEEELEKALLAFQKGVGVIFENGATQRIEAIIPDDVKMMGWNEGYKPSPEEQGEINRNPKCISARRLVAQIKDHIALGTGEKFKELTPVVKYTRGPTQIKEMLK